MGFFYKQDTRTYLRTVVLTKENSHHSGFYKCAHLIGWLLYMYSTIIKNFQFYGDVNITDKRNAYGTDKQKQYQISDQICIPTNVCPFKIP